MVTLPSPRAPLAGRGGDLARVAALCDDGAAIVTLWGPPGIGKTRLAIELCRRGALRRGGRPASTWFCDLSAARDATDVCDAVCRGLDLERPPGCAVRPAALAAALAERGPALVVLDGFEQVVGHAADTVGAWAEANPDVCFLVTSRERLRLSGEVLHEVGALGPEAAQLFADLALASGVTEVDPYAITLLIARLEGIPLAIELAASRLDLLGVEGLLAELDHPLEVLDGGGARDADRHQATLRDTLDASVRRLSPAERRAYAQCAVFRGGFSLEAAAAVIEIDAGAAALREVLHGLRERALLRREQDGGATRFALYEALRAHAQELLDTEGDGDARVRHARHFLAAAVAGLHPADQANLVDAVGAALADPAAWRGDTIACALERIDPGSVSDALLAPLGRALEAGTLAPAPAAQGYRLLGRTLALRGRTGEARAALERALELAGADARLASALWADLGVVFQQLRDTGSAADCYRAALARAEPLADPALEARCLGDLGAVLHDVRRLDEAQAAYQRAIAAFRAAGDHRAEGIFLGNLAVLLEELGAFARARATYELALERLAQAGDRRLEAITRSNLGLLCHEVGELDEARRCHEAALATLRDVVDVRSAALCLGRLAAALAALGRDDEARGCERRAERMIAAEGDPLAMGALALFRALVALQHGADEEFVRDRLAEARASTFSDGSSLLDRCDDARAAVRLIEAALAARHAPARVLVVASDGAWFAPAEGDRRELAGRHLLRRLLLHLVRRHREAPGEGATLDQLRDAGWPGERALAEAALNRVHVALSELRRRGLKGLLLRHEARYLLDPAVRVEISDS